MRDSMNQLVGEVVDFLRDMGDEFQSSYETVHLGLPLDFHAHTGFEDFFKLMCATTRAYYPLSFLHLFDGDFIHICRAFNKILYKVAAVLQVICLKPLEVE